jgi:hypothetical protein
MTLAAGLDADVLVPAALRDTLLRAAEGGLYRVHWSIETLDETRRTLVGQGLTTCVTPITRRSPARPHRPVRPTRGSRCIGERYESHL